MLLTHKEALMTPTTNKQAHFLLSNHTGINNVYKITLLSLMSVDLLFSLFAIPNTKL